MPPLSLQSDRHHRGLTGKPPPHQHPLLLRLRSGLVSCDLLSLVFMKLQVPGEVGGASVLASVRCSSFTLPESCCMNKVSLKFPTLMVPLHLL